MKNSEAVEAPRTMESDIAQVFILTFRRHFNISLLRSSSAIASFPVISHASQISTISRLMDQARSFIL